MQPTDRGEPGEAAAAPPAASLGRALGQAAALLLRAVGIAVLAAPLLIGILRLVN